MSEIYEAVIVVGEQEIVRNAFGALDSTLELRLIPVTRNVFAIYRDCSRDEALNLEETQRAATSLSIPLGAALSVCSDNRCGINTASLFHHGEKVRDFGEADEVWVKLDEEGEPMINGPRLTAGELKEEEEYERIRSPIDAGLTALSPEAQTSAEAIKQAVCYGVAS